MPELAQPDPRTSRVPIAAFFVALVGLWLLAGAFYGGDIGKTRDDYTWAVNDPVTGDIAIVDMWRLPLFWRPLSLILVRHLVSLTWDAPWIANLLTATSHLILTVVLWRWLRTLGFTVGAGAAALLFLTLPMAFDVMHWPAAMPTAISGVLALVVAALASKRITARSIAAIAGLTFTICCFNEQAAACMAAMVLLPFATGGPLRTRVLASCTLATSMVFPCLLYIVLVAITAPASHRGGAATLMPSSNWPARASTVVEGAWSQLLGPHGRDLTLGGLEVGFPELGIIGIALGVTSVFAGFAWACTLPARDGESSPRRDAILAVTGIIWFFLGLVPFIVVQTGPVEARHVYLPMIGVLLSVLAMCKSLGRVLPAHAHSISTRACAILAIGCASAMAVSLVGIQTTLRERYILDMTEAQLIAELYPDPEPGAVILIARAAWREADTGRRYYDMRFWSAWQMDHIATAVLRHEYGRDDIFAKNRFSIAFGAPASQFGEDGWTIDLSRGPAWDGGKLAPAFVPWDRILALQIDQNGNVVHINQLVLKQQGQPDRTIELPSVHARKDLTGSEAFEIRLR